MTQPTAAEAAPAAPPFFAHPSQPRSGAYAPAEDYSYDPQRYPNQAPHKAHARLLQFAPAPQHAAEEIDPGDYDAALLTEVHRHLPATRIARLDEQPTPAREPGTTALTTYLLAHPQTPVTIELRLWHGERTNGAGYTGETVTAGINARDGNGSMLVTRGRGDQPRILEGAQEIARWVATQLDEYAQTRPVDSPAQEEAPRYEPTDYFSVAMLNEAIAHRITTDSGRVARPGTWTAEHDRTALAFGRGDSTTQYVELGATDEQVDRLLMSPADGGAHQLQIRRSAPRNDPASGTLIAATVIAAANMQPTTVAQFVSAHDSQLLPSTRVIATPLNAGIDYAVPTAATAGDPQANPSAPAPGRRSAIEIAASLRPNQESGVRPPPPPPPHAAERTAPAPRI